MTEKWRNARFLDFLISCFLVLAAVQGEMFLADALGKGPSLTRDRNIFYISNSAKPKEF